MGLKMTCTRWHKRSNGKLRCAKFEKAKKVGRSPKCPEKEGLKGGGRSQWAIRPKRKCPVTGGRTGVKKAAKRTKRTAKRARRSSKK